MMDEQLINQVRRLLPALESLARSTRDALASGTYQGTADMAARSYRSLHAKIAALLPDDPYITDALALDYPDTASDREKIAAVQLAVTQLNEYLKGQMRGVAVGSAGWAAEIEQLKDVTRSLSDRILAQTRESLRRAMADIDIEINLDDETRRKRGGKVKRRVILSDEEDLVGADFSGQDLSGRRFEDQDLTGANFSGAVLRDADFNHCQLVNASFSAANLERANLEGADLSSADLSGAVLRDANLEDAVLMSANLSAANLERANLEDADLSSADLSSAALRDANLEDAQLVGARLDAANLEQANLRSANLTGARLQAANLRNTSLREADLTDADLRDANLRGTNLRSADLSGAILPDGSSYQPGADLYRFHVSKAPESVRGAHAPQPPAPPEPPEPPAPPAPPVIL
ncbi:MAG: hypothetical protein BroJett033_9400 [Chloroflexota bacterium]|nr:MAG: hypothetical protein BroJett033_9400 [Chloroflexota bacterium]